MASSSAVIPPFEVERYALDGYLDSDLLESRWIDWRLRDLIEKLQRHHNHWRKRAEIVSEVLSDARFRHHLAEAENATSARGQVVMALLGEGEASYPQLLSWVGRFLPLTGLDELASPHLVNSRGLIVHLRTEAQDQITVCGRVLSAPCRYAHHSVLTIDSAYCCNVCLGHPAAERALQAIKKEKEKLAGEVDQMQKRLAERIRKPLLQARDLDALCASARQQRWQALIGLGVERLYRLSPEDRFNHVYGAHRIPQAEATRLLKMRLGELVENHYDSAPVWPDDREGFAERLADLSPVRESAVKTADLLVQLTVTAFPAVAAKARQLNQ